MIEKILEQIDENTLTKESVYFLNEHGIKLVSASKMKEIVQEVAKDGGWIPVEEKNPTLFESVYVTCISLVDERPPWVIEGIYGTEGWHGMSYMLRWGEAKVIAWMPKELPAPYQKGEGK